MRRSILGVFGFGAVALVATLAPACSSSDDVPPPLSAPGNLTAPTEIKDLDPVTGTVDLYMPVGQRPVLTPGADPGAAALDFVAKNGPLFGVPDAKASYAVDGVIEDDGATSVRLQQIVSGIQVAGVYKTVHFADDGSVAFVEGAYVPNLDAIAKIVPTVDDATARSIAIADVRQRDALAPTEIVDAKPSTLVIYVGETLDSATARLARRSEVAVGGTPANRFSQVFVDALAANVLTRWAFELDATEQRVAATGYKGRAEQIPVVVDGPQFMPGRLPQPTRASMTVAIYAPELKWLTGAALAGPWDTQAVSAVANVERVEAFFASSFRWTGKPIAGGRTPMEVTVMLPAGYSNAFGGASPDGTVATITFTSGDGKDSFVDSVGITGHELTHVINALSNGLGQEGLAGAISEGIADVFGVSARNAARGGSSYMFAEVERNAKDPLATSPVQRDNYKNRMPRGADPRTDGTNHYNATIVSHAWYLMTEGGTNRTSKREVLAPALSHNPSQRLWWATLRRIINPRMQITALSRAQVAQAQTTKGIDPKPVACAWLAVDALTEEWVKQRNIDCKAQVPDAGVPSAADAGVADAKTPDIDAADPKIDGGYGGCAHEVCSFGEPLGPQCSPCTQKVCVVDNYCCTEHWGPSCWVALEAQCGIKCQ